MPQSRGIENGEVGVGCVEEHPHRSRRREDGIGGFQEGEKQGKGMTFEVQIKKKYPIKKRKIFLTS